MVTGLKRDVKVGGEYYQLCQKKKKEIIISKLFPSNLEYNKFEPVRPWTL